MRFNALNHFPGSFQCSLTTYIPPALTYCAVRLFRHSCCNLCTFSVCFCCFILGRAAAPRAWGRPACPPLRPSLPLRVRAISVNILCMLRLGNRCPNCRVRAPWPEGSSHWLVGNRQFIFIPFFYYIGRHDSSERTWLPPGSDRSSLANLLLSCYLESLHLMAGVNTQNSHDTKRRAKLNRSAALSGLLGSP